jgi:hypothetical protein
MGLFEFILLCFVVVALAWVGCWALDTFMPGHPGIVNKIIWGVAIFIIIWQLLAATGILGHDPRIPHV